MKTYLLTWNPEKWPWEGFQDMLSRVATGKFATMSWSCVNKSPCIGDRVFLLKQGKGVRGVMGRGRVTRTQYVGRHYDERLARLGKKKAYIDFAFTHLLDPQDHGLLFISEIQKRILNGPANFTPQSSGVLIEDSAAAKLEILWQQHLKNVVLDPELSAFEGEEKNRFVLYRKRERTLREAKIEEALGKNGSLKCEVPRCNFDFKEIYGEIGTRYAQVHHVIPLAKNGIRKTTLSDLRIVCANCHAMIHWQGQCRPIESLIPERTRYK